MTEVPGPAASEELQNDGFGSVRMQPLTRIQQISAARLHASWTQIPHVTHHEEADVTTIDADRRALQAGGLRPSLLAYVARACVLALQEFPKFCASFDPAAQALKLKNYVNLGIAVETPKGLVVAVAHGIAGRSVEELAAVLHDLATRAKAGRLKPSEMEGSCFTITSLGNLGGVGFTPIINAPDVAILGVSQARWRPSVVDGAIVPRLLLPLSLSYDHRVIDGADAARFCSRLREALTRAVR